KRRAARRVAMKMGRRLRCSSVTYQPDMLLPIASPARTALPAAHFDRNATTPVTDLVHSKVTPHPVWLPSCAFLLLPFDKFGRRLRLATDRPWRDLEPSL